MTQKIFYMIAVLLGLMIARIVNAAEPKQMTMTLKPEGKVIFTMAGFGEVVIDWGDGSVCKTYKLLPHDRDDWHSNWQKYAYSYKYSRASVCTIKITGENITHFECASLRLTNLEVSEITALTYLDCRNNQLKNLEVTKNIALTSLHCHLNRLTYLDVSKNRMLINLWCFYNQLISLDVSNNTRLIDLSCFNNQLTNLDVSRNTTLKRLNGRNNQLSTSALDALFETLYNDTISGERRICMHNNPGTDSCNQNIATEKGWTVTCPTPEEERYAVMETPPLFEGKDPEVSFREYVSRKTVYPQAAQRNNIEGLVLVEFTINRQGKLVNAKIKQSVHSLLDTQALRVVNSSPKWTPGMHRGKPVGVSYTFSFVFRLPK